MYTLIVATRPDEPHLDQALASVAQQSHRPDAVIVVVNGFGASSSEIAGQLRHHNLAPTVITTECASQPAAYSVVLDKVKTPLVAFLDADDLWHPTKQQRQMGALSTHGNADVCLGGIVNFRIDELGVRHDQPPVTARLFGACTFRTRAFREYGAPDSTAEHFTWLYRWWSQAESAGIATISLHEPVLFRRVHRSNGWVTANAEGRRQLLGEVRRLTKRSREPQ